MQLFPILLVAAVLAADNGLALEPPRWLLGGTAAAAACVPVLLVVAVVAAGLASCRRRLDGGRGPQAVVTADRIIRAGTSALLIVHVFAVLATGWLPAIRGITGDLVLLDEIVALLPPVLGLLAIWWLHYPIERRLREALLVRRLDLGRPVYPMPRRGEYVLLQARVHLLLLLVPLLLILALSELIDRFVPEPAPPGSVLSLRELLTLVAGVSVFVFAPFMARSLLSVRPLAACDLRDGLLEVCRAHRVSVRDVLVWNTSGTMINAAVMGLVGRLRYVLLTDGLLETMRHEHVLAVMAHEIGHVRRHHMPWLVGVLLAAIGLTSLLQVPMLVPEPPPPVASGDTGSLLETGLVAGQLLLALALFGWVSRRFERQADTFAVQHLSGHAPVDEPAGEGDAAAVVTDEAIAAMTGALETIARLNAVDRRRRSWRHGSIAWRQEYLRSLAGLPLVALPIDRLVRRLKLAAAAVLITSVGGIVWLDRETTEGPDAAGATLSPGPATVGAATPRRGARP